MEAEGKKMKRREIKIYSERRKKERRKREKGKRGREEKEMEAEEKKKKGLKDRGKELKIHKRDKGRKGETKQR